MNNNLIHTKDGDIIGMQPDLMTHFMLQCNEHLSRKEWEWAKDDIDVLQGLNDHHTPNLLMVSEHNGIGMGLTVQEYRPGTTFTTPFTSLYNSLGRGHLLFGISATYFELACKLGEPKCGGSADGKTQVEWHIRLDDARNTEFSIYDWKEDVEPKAVTKWHIGGEDKDLQYVRDFLLNEQQFEEA